MKKIIIILLFTLSALYAATINVPGDAPTIQQGILQAADGDTVLVARGRYYENINFKDKDIVVASHYIQSMDRTDIDSTIIDGSRPVHADTASCVLIVKYQTRATVLQGFTLTGGTGTRWSDEHGYGDYIEGGGILITRSSPTIRDNIIRNNTAIRKEDGTTSAGGGAIRCGDGSPLITHNIIRDNEGMYGAGIVMNFAAGEIEYNVIFNNKVYEAVAHTSTFGGGGIWIYGDGQRPYVRHNTIVGNQAIDGPGGVSGRGGGILVYDTPATIQNNILWDNVQLKDGQIYVTGTDHAHIEYNNIMGAGNDNGDHNIDKDPLFCDPGSQTYTLAENSPCIGSGMEGDTLGALDVDCGIKMVTRDVSGSVNYGAGADTLHFVTTLYNPDGHTVHCFAVLNHVHEAVTDSVELFRTDFGPGNQYGIWTGMVTGWDAEETYSVKSRCYDQDDSMVYTSYDSVFISTSGPVVYQSYGLPYTDHPPMPGEDIYFQLTLRNTGTQSPARDIFVQATPGDSTWISEFWSQPMNYGDIAPGDSVTSLSTYWIRVSEDCPGNVDIPVIIDISSEGVYYWRDSLFVHVDFPTGVRDDNPLPDDYKLYDNYPNPFNPATHIAYDLPALDDVSLDIYNMSGEKIRTLYRGSQSAGHQSLEWDGRNDHGVPVSSGVYVYKLYTDHYQASHKMLLLK